MPRRLPSASQLPERIWDAAMDRYICFLDAEGEHTAVEIVYKIKQHFPILESDPCVNQETVAARIAALDTPDNNYFRVGCQKACQIAEENGFHIADFDPDIYLPKPPTPQLPTSNASSRNLGIRRVEYDRVSGLDEDIVATASGFESMISAGDSGTAVDSTFQPQFANSTQDYEMGAISSKSYRPRVVDDSMNQSANIARSSPRSTPAHQVSRSTLDSGPKTPPRSTSLLRPPDAPAAPLRSSDSPIMRKPVSLHHADSRASLATEGKSSVRHVREEQTISEDETVPESRLHREVNAGVHNLAAAHNLPTAQDRPVRYEHYPRLNIPASAMYSQENFPAPPSVYNPGEHVSHPTEVPRRRHRPQNLDLTNIRHPHLESVVAVRGSLKENDSNEDKSKKSEASSSKTSSLKKIFSKKSPAPSSSS